MPTQIELLTEAYNRGILPEDKKPLYEEAVRRGLIQPTRRVADTGTSYDQAVASLGRVRQKYPEYGDMDDSTLASKLAAKYPAYADIHAAINSPGAGLHEALAPMRQDATAEARSQAVGDILHRQQGTALVQTATDTSGTDVSGRSLRTLEPQQVNTPQQLSSSEQLAILDAHLKDKLGIEPMTADRGQQQHQQQEQLAANQLQQRFDSRSMGVANTSNAALLPILKIYPNLVDLFAPGTAEDYKADLDRLLAADPNSYGTKAGSILGGAVPYMLGPAGVAVGGASAAGEFRDQVHQARQQGAQIDPVTELAGAATIIASNMAMGKFRPGAATATVENLATQQALKATVATAVKKYALDMGYSASDMMINGLAEDAVHKATVNPDMQIGGGSVDRMLLGAAAHGIMGAKGFIRDLKAGVHGEGVESKLQALYDQKTEADRQLQSGEPLAPDVEAKLKKTSDHNAALMQEVLDRVEKYDGPQSMEDMLDRITSAVTPEKAAPVPTETAPGESTVKVETPNVQEPPKPIQVRPSLSEDFARLMQQPASNVRPGEVGEAPPEPTIQEQARQAAEIADKGVGANVRKLLGEPSPGLPEIPREARDWSFTKIKQWAKDNGYDVARAENLRSLRQLIGKQRTNSHTDLPELPGESSTWNFRRLKYWAGQNGYDVEHAESRQEIKDIVDSARKADIEFTRNGATVEEPAAPAPAAKAATTDAVKEAVVGAPKPAANVPAESPIAKTVKALTNPIADVYDQVVAPIGSLIRRHSQRLYGRVQQMYVRGGQSAELSMGKLIEPAQRITEFLGGDNSPRYKRANLLALNGKRDALIEMFPEQMKQDVTDFYDMFRQKIGEQKEAGVNIGDLGEGYWNRTIKDYKAFKKLYGDDTGVFDQAIAEAQAKQGKPLTDAEKMDIINSVAQGYGPRKPGQMGPTHARERSIEELTPDQAEHYTPWIESAFAYADRSSRLIERYKLLGKNYDPQKPETLTDSVGAIVAKEIQDGTMKPESQAEVKELLNTLLTRDQVIMPPWARKLKAATHFAMLGQVRSMLNQTADFVVTAVEHGWGNAIKGYMNAAGLRPGVKKVFQEELGFHGHGEEFKDVSKFAHTVDVSLKGFEIVDRFGKEGRANAAFERFARDVKSPDSVSFKRMAEKWEPILGKEGFGSILSDLREGAHTPQVFELLALDALEIQPMTPANMPQAYLKSNRMRLAWMLKSYTINQVDNIVRDVRSDFQNQNGIRGAKKLAHLAIALTLFNFGKDLIVDLIRGKRVAPDQVKDRTVESMMSITGLNRFTGENFVMKPATTMEETSMIPVQWIDDLVTDIRTGGMRTVGGTKHFRGLNTTKYAPIVGDIINYRTPLGRGYYQNEDEERKVRNQRLRRYGGN